MVTRQVFVHSPRLPQIPAPFATSFARLLKEPTKEVFHMLDRYTYQSVLAASEMIHWRIEDIIGGEKRLDFHKPFMPESLARVEPLTFLNYDEKRILNQIRGNAYLSIFGLVEEFILPFVLDQARPQLSGDDYRVRALLGFAGRKRSTFSCSNASSRNLRTVSGLFVRSSARPKQSRRRY
jgi:hypothetical protein